MHLLLKTSSQCVLVVHTTNLGCLHLLAELMSIYMSYTDIMWAIYSCTEVPTKLCSLFVAWQHNWVSMITCNELLSTGITITIWLILAVLENQLRYWVFEIHLLRIATAMHSDVGSISWLVRRGRGCATTCELCAKIIAESELLQPGLNEIHKFCFQYWSCGRSTCRTGSGTPDASI